ncbi:16S rRNA (cytosine(1402)-N(4))-methyltransferase RsmH [Nocardioides yefusunii]|uniref:Ribosomal RNA small subunit methyltransferase H n=1 Tax=Nocardioides yefusunii TaxID=2500546 RepID=A0ABW1QUZ0_9ACTN|nr:16S rRNA (cytosine(1402)-N(4))-methyltransferase RsmH [Nocardioides yefusunii]
MPNDRHMPVLRQRCVDLLAPALSEPGSVMVDCTLGLGGHTEAVLEAIPTARVIGIDRDPQAIALASERLAPFGDRFTAFHGTYDEIATAVAEQGLDHADAVLFDLGVSSMQLDERERGFAYSVDAPLDMRMNGSAGITAADIMNTYTHAELTRVLREYGEEKFASKIARAIIREREIEPWTRSGRLVELLYAEIPAPARRTGGHPGKRTFQALRMEVNDELGVLRRAIPASLEVIGVGGRVVVESYHSLEDRMVKRFFTDATKLDLPPDLPFVPEGAEPEMKLVIRGSEMADEVEIEHNPRAASVRLRAVERVRGSKGGRR